THGIIGVAIAWLLRAAMDATLLTLMTHWLVKDTTAASKQIYPALVAPLSLFAIGMMLHEVTAKLFFIGFASLALITGGYFFVLTPEEKKAIQGSTQRFLRSLSSKQRDPHLRRRR